MSKCNLCDKHCNKKTTSFDQCAARIRTQYQHFCNEYLRLFCHKHEFDFDEATAAWVADDVGGTVCIGDDLFFDMWTIRTDIDRDAAKEELLAWYDYTTEMAFLDMPMPNYYSWLQGCPRMTTEEIERLRALHGDVEQAREVLQDEVKLYKEKYNV